MTIPEPMHYMVRLFTTVTEYKRDGLNIRAFGSRISGHEIRWNTIPSLLAGFLISLGRYLPAQTYDPFSAIMHHYELIDLIQSP